LTIVRTDLCPEAGDAGDVIAALCQLSDLHVMDAASPMRFEWIETLAHDPRWRPLLHMHRPQETLVPWAVAAHVAALRTDPVGTIRDRPFDLVLSTGDNIDNAQRNELDAYLELVAGGAAQLSPIGSAQDASGAPTGDPWPYWCPRGDVADTWKARGYPVVDDLLERAAEPIVSAGLGLPWASLPGNHDLLCQGTSFVNDALLAVATGASKALWPQAGFEPDDALALFVDRPEAFLGGGARPVDADPGRRGITLREWIDAHLRAGAAGFTAQHVSDASADAVVEVGDGVVTVLLDTNHPAGDYQGSVGTAQQEWLDEQLRRVDRAGGVALLASHHGPDTLVNDRGHDPARQLAPAMLAVVHRHRCVAAWLTGHRHIHRITPHPGPSGGFWEITTASVIDWPSERRSIEVVRHRDDVVELACTVDGHRAAPGSLAALHRGVAERFAGAQGGVMAGSALDRDVRLFVRT
jgi:metallophosphoesterase (TIGR03767 family)